ELRDRGARGAAVGELRDPQVMMRLTRHLRQMRHAEYLSTPAESAELAAHDLRDRAADAGVHLVEYHAARRLRRARYLHRERQPPLDLLLARGVDIEGLAIALELARRLAHLDRRLLQHRQQPRELAVESGESPQRLQRPAHRSVRARALVLVELRERGVSACGEAPAVREPCAFLAERLDLARPELEGLELLRLVAQELQPRVAVARLAFELERTVEEPEPRPMRDADLGGRLGERAVLVEQHALRGAARQGLELMLAMDIDEELAGLAQHLQRHRLPVEIGARAAVGSDDPPHDELVRAADRLLRQPLPELARDPGELEGARDLGALGAVAHRFRAGAPSGEQLQRIHHDRLA